MPASSKEKVSEVLTTLESAVARYGVEEKCA